MKLFKLVNSEAFNVVKTSKFFKVVMKRAKYLKQINTDEVLNARKNIEELTSKLRIFIINHIRSSNLFVKIIGICYKKTTSDLNLTADHFHLCLEYSRFENMTFFLQSNENQLNAKLKIEFIHQIVNDLIVLHIKFVCHENLKIQNVLMFEDKKREYVTKLTNFEINIYSENRTKLIHFTCSFKAVRYSLETILLNVSKIRNNKLNTQFVDINEIIKSDIFSFDLLM